MHKKTAFALAAVFFSLWTTTADAKILKVVYKVSFGILGEMGRAEATLDIDPQNRYTIRIHAYATGLAKTLSKNRQETHISKGVVKDGIFYSRSYEVIKSYGKKYLYKRYRLDEKKRKIEKYFYAKKNGTIYKEGRQTLPFWTRNDLLTLYFNIRRLIPDKTAPGRYRFQAMGAERQHGEVEVIVPDSEARKRYIDTLGKGDFWYITAIIHQKIFDSDRGELMLAVDKEGITQKAVLKDLVMFGDLVAERIE